MNHTAGISSSVPTGNFPVSLTSKRIGVLLYLNYALFWPEKELTIPMTALTRRHLILIAGGGATAAAIARPAFAAEAAIHVVKDRNCGCCTAWIDVLQAEGFTVTTEDSLGTLLMRYKSDNGIPQDMILCHTGRIDQYMLEGHVSPSDIRRLLAERPGPCLVCPTAHQGWVRKANARHMMCS